jgi:hypothetical protein
MEAPDTWDDVDALDPDLDLLGEDDDPDMALSIADEDLLGIDTDDD